MLSCIRIHIHTYLLSCIRIHDTYVVMYTYTYTHIFVVMYTYTRYICCHVYVFKMHMLSSIRIHIHDIYMLSCVIHIHDTYALMYTYTYIRYICFRENT